MPIHPLLNQSVIIALIVVACLVVAYWVYYTRSLKTPRNVGKQEGIAMATSKNEHRNNTRHAA
jgi:hypothetical protein